LSSESAENNEKAGKKKIRYALIFIWFILYLTFVIIFGIRLGTWDVNVKGHCYNASKVALPDDPHPAVDFVYISLTCTYLCVSLMLSVGADLPPEITEKITIDEVKKFLTGALGANRQIVLTYAFLQYPLHIYSIFALRSSNEPLLTSGTTEIEWGYAQIVNVVLLGSNIKALLDGIVGRDTQPLHKYLRLSVFLYF
jgi:hypothetical protein